VFPHTMGIQCYKLALPIVLEVNMLTLALIGHASRHVQAASHILIILA